MKGSTTRQQAINEMCKQCIYDPVGGHGNWKQQVSACGTETCPLFHYRPISQSKPDKSDIMLNTEEGLH